MKKLILVFLSWLSLLVVSHDNWKATRLSEAIAHAPSVLPDRVVLTWNNDPATTQSVSWRTDTSVMSGYAQFGVASASGRTMETIELKAITTLLKSDINDAHYHNVTFTNLEPNTLYAYRVGDGENWTEYYHFKTANLKSDPFSFIYFGDAQNEVKTHWSRVFREAFQDSPRAAFTLHAGDLVDEHYMDAQWGEWHQAPDWVNGTIPVIATPGNHEYLDNSQRKRIWKTKKGNEVKIKIDEYMQHAPGVFKIIVEDDSEQSGTLFVKDSGQIESIDSGIELITGYSAGELKDKIILGGGAPLYDRLENPTGSPILSKHWRPQFSFPIQDVTIESLKETIYYIDYQGVRFISLNSNTEVEAQTSWLQKVLEQNPNKWTVITFHHPLYSPASDRDNVELRQLWKPLFDKHRVDLILSGHDHTYSRTGLVETKNLKNVPTGYQQAYDPEIGTVNVVSVSGPKMYEITKGKYAKTFGENMQLYQIIDIDNDILRFRAFTATGDLHDEFLLKKITGKPNMLIEK
tara:strand:- start:3345 stop:4901 length:1557 start_codon:yes stop_codon:yes gene_type:complete